MMYKPQLKIWAAERAQDDYKNGKLNSEKQVTERAQFYFDLAYEENEDFLALRNRIVALAESRSIELLRLEEFKDTFAAIWEARDARDNPGVAKVVSRLGNKGTA